MSPRPASPARPWRTSRAIPLAVAVIVARVVSAVGALGWRDFRHVAAETKAALRAETNRVVTHADLTLEAAELAMERLATRFAVHRRAMLTPENRRASTVYDADRRERPQPIHMRAIVDLLSQAIRCPRQPVNFRWDAGVGLLRRVLN